VEFVHNDLLAVSTSEPLVMNSVLTRLFAREDLITFNSVAAEASNLHRLHFWDCDNISCSGFGLPSHMGSTETLLGEISGPRGG
jgi:hypothetical protein